jgi:ATP-dependent Clp protease ATP-binding subunit ClpC
MFDREDAMTRVDMSEFQERHTVSRLIGAPPGYVGYDDAGQLTESVRRRPYQVVLFDEIEKAHPDVFNTLLQVLDDGRLTDGQGHTIDFRNTVVIMTSNVGTEHVRQQSIGLVRAHDRNAEAAAKERVNEALRQSFRPEFLNRIDEIIVFQALTEPELTQIVDLLVAEVAERLHEQDMALELTPAAKELLVREGYVPAYGARPLRRTIQRMIETRLSREILKGEYKAGDTIVVDAHGRELSFGKRELLELGEKKPAAPMGT